ncbi:ABC transporter ATP-binding protein [Streptomyces pluripotens]|uniref:ABC transporter ATP-binding protein n=2 Tax=Streptomyces TaxID=1883 RepID=A0A221P7V0_9ACTN|nr:ABC transporter ATP-binding protein [Streptomyces pluripotens]ASN28280.1 ABC transporter ATP-binding protein [Streptomyces pluripotens]MCH0555694.1 ATP-binding cassette domain-containing protein [Streptomyces sp. MUM 16J]
MGPRGWVFRGIGIDAEPGSLIAIEGPSGSGRTCLLLTLTGRMKPTGGTATVGGLGLPRHMAAVRRIGAVANVAGVTDLEPALTVGEHLRERALLQHRFGDSLRELLRPRAQRALDARLRVDAALDAAGLDLDSLSKGSRTPIRDLERPAELRLSIALALLGEPRLLGVDDIDTKLSDAERTEIWELLRSLTRAGTTVMAVCRSAPLNCVTVATRESDAKGERKNDRGESSDQEHDAHDRTGHEDDGTDQHDQHDRKEDDDALTEAGRA